MAVLTYRRLTPEDVPLFAEMRIRQLREEGATETLDLMPALLRYYNEHLTDGTFVSWLAVCEGTIIGTSGMSFVEKPPYYCNPTGKSACCPACTPTRTTAEKALQGHCWIVL